jgi:DNA adenine methylase
VLLARPSTPKVETVNDKDGLIANFWRAVQHAPGRGRALGRLAGQRGGPARASPVARRKALPLTEKLIADPDYYDAKVAGWWVWGICSWIGNGWCSRDERG